MPKKPSLTVILGPTVSGKTDYAIQLAKRMEGDPTSLRRRGAGVVSADSRQVYRGMDIGTAKVRDTHGIPHHLIDIREPDQPLSLPEWQSLAVQAIDSILAEGKRPILAGGTMLYIDSIIYNFDIPRVRPNLEFRAKKERIENRKLYEELLEKDPEAKKFIELGNTRRIIRALEVIQATGKPFSAQRKRREPRYQTTVIGLFPGWEELKKRIEARARNMFEEGLLLEMQRLRTTYNKNLPLLQTLNYRQAGGVLDGAMSQEEAIESMVRDTLQYGHRQMSWWKGRSDIQWVRSESSSAAAR